MERKITRVECNTPTQPKLVRVAAYARVSSGKDAMLHSLSAQVSYYSDLIQRHPGWLYCGVYADEALTGTKEDRANFQRLLTDCRAGKIEKVITKSISRFARNTVTLLQSVRELKGLGIDIYFEEQNIHTMSADGELMLTILASYAQEESRSASENQKWRIKKNFEAGLPWNCTVLGYRFRDGEFVIVPEEAEVVRRIFQEYISGRGVNLISKCLNHDGIPTRNGGRWSKNCITRIIDNEAYCGSLLLQKTYRENHLTKVARYNKGQLPMYFVENAHEPIIDRETWEMAQAIRKQRSLAHPAYKIANHRYSRMIICGCCGKHYVRKVAHGYAVWICNTFSQLGKAQCPSKQIPENTLDALTEGVDLDSLLCLRAEPGNIVRFCYRDGTEVTKQWKDRSRSESWTPEKREAMRQKQLQRRKLQ